MSDDLIPSDLVNRSQRGKRARENTKRKQRKERDKILRFRKWKIECQKKVKKNPDAFYWHEGEDEHV